MGGASDSGGGFCETDQVSEKDGCEPFMARLVGSPVRPCGPGPLSAGRVFIADCISLLVTGLFK